MVLAVVVVYGDVLVTVDLVVLVNVLEFVLVIVDLVVLDSVWLMVVTDTVEVIVDLVVLDSVVTDTVERVMVLLAVVVGGNEQTGRDRYSSAPQLPHVLVSRLSLAGALRRAFIS